MLGFCEDKGVPLISSGGSGIVRFGILKDLTVVAIGRLVWRGGDHLDL